MDKPIIFFIIIGIVIVLFFSYGGSFVFERGPLATGPGRGAGGKIPAGGESSFGFIPLPASEEEKPEPGTSPLKKRVNIATVHTSDEGPEKEYVIMRRSGFSPSAQVQKETIPIMGWTIENNKGIRHQIPSAFRIPSFDSSPAPVELAEGDEVIITSSHPTSPTSFKENICTGYFNESHPFTPSLDESCPEFSRQDLQRQGLNSMCIDVIERTPRCRQVTIGFEEAAAGNDCIAFSQSHLTYAGCVNDNRAKPDFFSNRWRVFLQRGSTLFDPVHDRVILRDKEGLIVDEYSY